METLLYILFAIVCVLLIGLILVQQGKGAGVGFSMGGASQAMFGGSGGREFFIKLTAGLMVAFVFICIILARMASSHSGQYNGVLAGAQAPAPAGAAQGLPGQMPAGQPLSAAPAAAAPAAAAAAVPVKPSAPAPVAPAPAKK